MDLQGVTLEHGGYPAIFLNLCETPLDQRRLYNFRKSVNQNLEISTCVSSNIGAGNLQCSPFPFSDSLTPTHCVMKKVKMRNRAGK